MTDRGREPESLNEAEHALANLLLAESREELTRADAKASVLLAAGGIGLSAILGAILAGDWVPFVLTSPWEFLWWIGSSFAAAALIGLGVAVWPRVTHKSGRFGVTYFGEAASFDSVPELIEALKSTETSPVNRTVLQLHVISRRASQKYAAIRVSLMFLAFAITLTLVAVLGDHF